VKNKKWLLLLVIAFPSFFWLILETSTINSKKLPYYGPKKVIKNDTLFYSVPDIFLKLKGKDYVQQSLDTFPLYAIVLINHKYRDDSYRLTGLWEYLKYKKSKIEHIPFILVTEVKDNHSQAYEELKSLEANENVNFYGWHKNTFDSITKIYFKEKPYYIDYSFFMLIDSQRNIRGYYDARYVSELKRLIEEYQHLRLKEEKHKLIKENEIKIES
jgi:hypothetical protein